MTHPRLHSLNILRTATAVGAFALASFLPSSAVFAASFSDVVFFGDSLSDTGNRYKFMTDAGAWDDGLLGGLASKEQSWTWQVAKGLGVENSAKASLLGGNNYAYGGATTGYDLPDQSVFIPSMTTQVGQWGTTHATADANALYVLVGGHNDVRYAGVTFSGSDATSQAERQLIVNDAIQNLKDSMLALSNKGAKHMMVSSLMDLGNTFAAQQAGLAGVAHDTSMYFNSLAPSLVSYGQGLGVDVRFFDLNGVLNDIRDDAQNHAAAKYGITDITHPCTGDGSTGVACNVSLYVDDVHPSARTHEIIAQAALRAVGVSPVPEPQTYALLLAGLGVMGAWVRRRKQAV
jgi:phospholipase/lecithinase/hemolysin